MGLASAIGFGALVDVFQRVAAATVFGQRRIAVIRVPSIVEHHVLDNRTKANGIPNDGFILLAEIDGFCITTAFDVEHRAFCPAVLIVANQVAIRICREGGLTRPRESKKQGGITAFTHIRRAVHGHDIFFWQQKVLYREHRLLHFPGIAHPGNEHFALTEIDDDGGIGMGTVTLRIANEVRDIEYFPLGLVGWIVGIGTNEHVARKQRLPSGRGDSFHG